MSLATHLVHTCTIQRATWQADPYQNETPVWANYLTSVRCRLVDRAQRVVSNERVQLTVVTTYTLLAPAGTDVMPDDRITVVREGLTVVDAGPFTVQAVLNRRGRATHHLSLALERAT